MNTLARTFLFLCFCIIVINCDRDRIRSNVETGIHEFVRTGKKSEAFTRFLNQYSFKHAFRQQPKLPVNFIQLCELCEPVVDAAIQERRNGMSDEEFVQMIVDLCVTLNIESLEVCEGAIRANADPVLYILDNKLDLTGNKVCGTVLQGNGCKSSSVTEWNIDIADGTTIDVEKGQQTDSAPIKVLQITDIHYDPNYLPGSLANCDEPLCCQSDKGLAENPEDAAGYWGDYRDCDSPRHLVINAYEHINKVHSGIDYIYFTGDIIRHKVWNTSVEDNLNEIEHMFADFQTYFPNTPIYPIFGNHESHPVNVYAPSTVTDSVVSSQWLYDQAAQLWSKWLPEEAQETIRKGGYYTALVRPGFRIVGINSNIYYVQNWWLLYDDAMQIEQLQWLADTLYEAEKNNEFVHILSHLPSGGGSAILSYSKAYRRILERFSNTITAIFQGHTHNDQWVVFHHAEDKSPIAVVWDGGSLTTASNLNYNYKIYDVDGENFFVAHSNVQQLLASIWYEGLPGFRRKNMFLQALEIVRIGMLFPIFSIGYIIAPHSIIGQTMRKPFIKFICHSASYFTFLFLLILASQRIENLFFNEDVTDLVPTKRGAMPSLVEWIILAWVSGLIWSEIKQLWDVGLEEYVRDMWNVIDFITNALYVATVALRVVSYYQDLAWVRLHLYSGPDKNKPDMTCSQVQNEGNTIADNNERRNWDAWDPMLISEGLFSAANIFSSLKLVYIFSVNPHLGPLQVSLSRMVMDIMKFIFLDVLVLFAFSCGLNQLLWYYAEAERQNCPDERPTGNATQSNVPDTNACQIWRRFANLFETSQTLFWAVFGLIELESFELEGIKIFTRFWGMLMFGTYSVINIVVLLNLLIAMMNHSYQLISERADVEWKFARSKLWISYFEEGGTVPPPFNIVPTPKSLWYIIQWVQRKFCSHSRAAKKEHMRTIRRKVKQASERDFRYQSIMRNLVRRYVTVEQRKAENQGVTEDDVNEIKQDISAFRFELIEILKNSGMNTSTAHSVMGSGTGGKKNRQKERRLMKGFNIGPQPSTTTGPLPPVAEFIASLQQHHEGHHHDIFGSTLSGIFNSTPRKILHHSTVSSSQGSINEGHHHRGLGRLQMKRTPSHKRRWGTLIEAAKTGKVSRLIGRSRSEDSVCNSHCRENGHNHSHSNSPASEDNITDSPTDSNPSLDRNNCQMHSMPSSSHESHGLTAGLSLLKKKRKKFSASRNTSPIVVPPNPVEHAIAVCMGKSNKKVSQVLKRASSVPTRVPEVSQLMLRHDQTQSQQDSVELPPVTTQQTLTPSTTEESVTNAGNSQITSGLSSREPLLYNSSSSNQATGSSQTPEEEYRGSKLQGVTPLSGHNCTSSGWL